MLLIHLYHKNVKFSIFAPVCYHKYMNIGVFDSGIGGRAVAEKLQQAFPRDRITLVDDRDNVPYGTRAAAEIIRLTDLAIQPLLKSSCGIIVLACNTATAAAIETLRKRYPDTTFVGLEPMLKPAAEMTKSGVIAICATPATLQSSRYQHLKQTYAAGITVLEPDCADWAAMIEDNKVDNAAIRLIVEGVCDQSADIIVLACTHYHWIKVHIREYAAGRAEIIEPSDALVRQVSRVLKL